MKIVKFQLITLNSERHRADKGGILVLCQDSEVHYTVVSSEYLHIDRVCRYFLKSNDPSIAEREFFPIREETSEDWTADPPPHVYQIELA